MNRITKLVSWVLIGVGVVSCSDNSDSTAIESSHSVIVTGIKLENVDNGQPVPVGGEPILGQVQIQD